MMDASPTLPMTGIRDKYLRNLVAQRADILRLSAGAGPDRAGPDRAGLRSCAHKLAGTGKIYGFPEISEAGYSLEAALRQEDAPASDIDRRTRYLLSVMDRAIRSHDAKDDRAEAPAGARVDGPTASARPTGLSPSSGTRCGQADAAGAPGREAGRPRLLVIDDDENITALVHSLFGPIADVVVRGDVPGGLLAAHEACPQLVLLDGEMPGERSGLDLLQQLHDMPITANVPIVMMSADDSLTSIMRALISGASDYLIKPFDPAVLMARGVELLRTCQARVLVVDDDETVRDLLAYKLGGAGCQVVTAGDAEEAWERLESESFSLVLLDRMMPDLDGTALLRRMQGDDATARIPVIFLTARRTAAEVVDGLLSGATDYITKPFDPDEVVKRCLALMKAKRH